jgi:hypothetical protein
MPNRIFHRFLRHEAGQIAIMTGLLMPVLIGGLGLGAEVSYWYFNQRKLQNAADVAAYAGAVQLRVGQDRPRIEAATLGAAVKTGYDESIGVITTNIPAATGAFAGDANTVEVIVRENTPRLFSSLFFDDAVPMSGRAVARLTQGNDACILALDPNARGAITFSGSSDSLLLECNVHANSLATDAISVEGNGRVQTPCSSTSGNVSATAGLVMTSCNWPIEHAEPIDDPLKDLAEPGTSGACVTPNTFGGAAGTKYTISPGRYCGMTIRREVKFNPGVYVIDGQNLKIESTAIVKGEGVTIFLTNGATFDAAGTADVQLSAPTSGPYAGILIFADRDNPYAVHRLNGNSSSFYEGILYAPSTHIEYSGNAAVIAPRCTQIVAATVEVIGNAKLGINCAGIQAVAGLKSDQLVRLVE